MTYLKPYARIDPLTLSNVVWGDPMQKVNSWKWANLGMGVLGLVGLGLHFNALDRAKQDYLVAQQRNESILAQAMYCDILKYQLLEGQFKHKEYRPFPEPDASQCKSKIPGFDPEVVNYVER